MEHKGYLALLVTCAFLLGIMSVKVVLGQGLSSIPASIINTLGTAQTNIQAPFNLSSQGLIDAAWMDSDALNTQVYNNDMTVPYMPGTARVQMLGCFDDVGTDQTTACNNATADDITLPVTGSGVYDFAFDNQARHLWLNITTAAVADWTITWQYYDGATFQTLSNVEDGTEDFTNAGLSRVTYDFPLPGQWPASTLHAVTGYWIRAEVTGFTSVTTPPTAGQAWYETGRWWVIADSLNANEQKRYDLFLNITPTSGSINPSIAASADDAVTAGFSGAYPPAFLTVADGGTSITPARSFDAANYLIRDAFLRFDTSAIPDDASVTSGTMTCTVLSLADTDSRSIVAEWYPWEGTEAFDYITTAAATQAITGTAISTIGVGSNSFALSNLHRINRAGYTGLRVSVSGGAPTGENHVEIQTVDGGTPCSLSLSYADKTFHYYFPHQDGYTLADNASLEPGNAFEITVAGYIDTSEDNGTVNIVSKSTDFRIRAGAGPDTVTVDVSGTLSTLGSSPFTAGYHEITVRQSGVGASDEIILVVDGNEVSSASSNGVPIPDNATDWTFFDGNGVYSAMDYIDYDVGGTQQFIHQLRDIPDYNLENHANPGTFDATARYPDTPTGLSESLQPLVTSDVTVGVTASEAANFIPVIQPLDNQTPQEYLNVPTADNIWDLPKYLMYRASQETDVPYAAVLIFFAYAGVTAVGVASYAAFRSIHVMYIVMLGGAAFAVVYSDGIWGWIVPITFAIMTGTYVFYKRH